MTRNAITSVSFLVFEDNIGEDGLSSQLTHDVNIDNPNYTASLSPDQKLLNHLKPSTENLKNIYAAIMKMLNELRLQLSTKHTLIAINHQCRTINTNIAQVQAKNVLASWQCWITWLD